MEEELLRTGSSMYLGLLLRGRVDTAASCGCGLAGVGGVLAADSAPAPAPASASGEES